jgi:hypothetical protein
LKGDGELLNNGVWTEGELRTCPSTETSAMARKVDDGELTA